MPNSIVSSPLGSTLRRWRLMRRIKQSHAAELFGVAQSTISRWESGVQQMAPAERVRVEARLAARLDSAGDRALARLVADSRRPVHLICDLTHRLLACSSAREAEFGVPLSDLMNRSMWRYATAEIAEQEARLAGAGWHDGVTFASLEFASGVNDSDVVPIRASRCRWTRMLLSDGTAARLVETM
ncbi:helix-turn-helix family protein [Burkholderia thailandensis MSMB121]|uniref:Helix-turn-helix transcriptional regulator n=2 Tax=Burkholderia humptydooensis TaxID=430531 RepID=A0A7U4SVC2_9BURK|nr:MULTISPECIES: helix-turn-helix transcriptional regulator [Burkholderia]AGK51649.1 helix-turn-helix family protein [Burkholderia thailandensis MSMB121]ATF33118.1 XRE family transcriptional regulator [Burkholderia thailandensis]AJY39749.1 helix-turn-helix family protein [Burkholderia sp. 2002721687]ALX46135.1 XRE family transcriptional regulator [Burkholderia humptydooensis]EIP87165.1 transcriptional regulator, XRE family protein [Burkholderia humptydooensis MSMB43]